MTKAKQPGQDMVALDSGVLVPRKLHDELFEHVRARIPALKYSAPHKARDMLEPRYYASQDPWFVGRCVSHWERHHELDVRFLGCPFCSVRYYERT